MPDTRGWSGSENPALIRNPGPHRYGELDSTRGPLRGAPSPRCQPPASAAKRSSHDRGGAWSTTSPPSRRTFAVIAVLTLALAFSIPAVVLSAVDLLRSAPRCRFRSRAGSSPRVSGEHPFAGKGVDEVTDRIRRQRLGRAARAPAGPDASSALIAFTASMLAAPRSARPATARAFADALHGVRRGQVGPSCDSAGCDRSLFPSRTSGSSEGVGR